MMHDHPYNILSMNNADGLTSPVLWFAESYPSISIFSFTDNGHFLIIFSVDFQFLTDFIGCRPTI